MLLDSVEADFRQSPAGNAGRIAVRDVQIDNQLLTSANPVVLAHATRMGHQVRKHALGFAPCSNMDVEGEADITLP